MKFTRILFSSTFGLSAIPLSLALEPDTSCHDNVNAFACNPFSPDVCAPIYITPELDKPDPSDPLTIPSKAATLLFNIVTSIIAAPEIPFYIIGTVIALPTLFASNDATPTYKVTDEFMKDMALNVKNYVAQEITTSEMEKLYDGIAGNNALFEATSVSYQVWSKHKDDTDADIFLELLTTQMMATKTHLTVAYPFYASNTPWDHPLETKDGSKTGFNGYGIYYSVFVTQMLTAFMQEIAVLGLKYSVAEQVVLVETVWKAIKHSQELVDTYVMQRESSIEDPTIITVVKGRDTSSLGYQIKDTWVNNDKQCSWEEINSISYPRYHPSFCPRGESGSWCQGYQQYMDCPQSTKDFVNTKSATCLSGRKQFVTGTIISNWNTWLIEPSKKWAAIADLICETTTESLVKTRCKNQGDANTKNYNNGGGKAVDYVTSFNIAAKVEGGDFVLGLNATSNCPQGTTHVTDQTQCNNALGELRRDNHIEIYGPIHVNNWGTVRPAGCFVYRGSGDSTNRVQFNTGQGGDNAGSDQPICYRSENPYQIQQTCQRNNSSMHVIATKTNTCTDYYKSQQDGSHSKTVFHDSDTAGEPGWMCCLLSSDSVCHLLSSTDSIGNNYLINTTDQQVCNTLSNDHLGCGDCLNKELSDLAVDGYAECTADYDSDVVCCNQSPTKNDYNGHVKSCPHEIAPYCINYVQHDRRYGYCSTTKHPEDIECTADYNSEVVCCDQPPTENDYYGHVKSCPYETTPYCRNYVQGSRRYGHCSDVPEGLVTNCKTNIAPAHSYPVKECSSWLSQFKVNTATTMLTGSSNEIHQQSNMPPLFMLGLIGLAMVATYKVVKDYRGRQHHHYPYSKQYNKLDYESLMEA